MTAVFPDLPGLTLEIEKTPNWGTRMQRAVSGREHRISDYVNPIWNFVLTYEFLRDGNDLRAGPGIGEGIGFDELRTLMGFFNQQQGAALPFLFEDPTDNTAVGQPLTPVPTDDTGTQWQLARSLQGADSEAILAPKILSAVYEAGSLTTAFSYDPAIGVVTFDAAPGFTPTADFTFYFLVRFAKDSSQFKQFSYQLWENKQVELTSIVL